MPRRSLSKLDQYAGWIHSADRPHEPISSTIGWPGTSPQPAKPRRPERCRVLATTRHPAIGQVRGTSTEPRHRALSCYRSHTCACRHGTSAAYKGSIWSGLQAVGRSSSSGGILIYHILQAFTCGAVYTGNKEELIPKEAFESSELHVGWKILTLTTGSLLLHCLYVVIIQVCIESKLPLLLQVEFRA